VAGGVVGLRKLRRVSDLERHILPIYVVPKPAPGEKSRPIRFAGTGFIATPNVFVTCWHCISDELPEDQTYAALRYEDKTVHRLSRIAQDPSGLDLATASVDIDTCPPFRLVASPPHSTGVDVGTVGYPGTYFEQRSDGTRQFDQQGRYLQGYISRAFEHILPSGGRPIRSYEIDLPCPRGLSGAPLIVITPEHRGAVIGVIYGAHPPFGSQSEAGEISLPPTVFALAHYFDTFMALRGPATSGRPLSALVPESQALPTQGATAGATAGSSSSSSGHCASLVEEDG
jgi:trypsin-like peptidase